MNIKSLTRLSVLAVTVAAGLGMSQPLLAAPGQCTNDEGVTDYPFVFTSVMTDPAQNIQGKIIENAENGEWNLPRVYKATCECTTMNAAYVMAKSLLTNEVYNDGRIRFFELNKYLAVGSEVKIGGVADRFEPVPFDYTSNQNDAWDSGCESQRYKSGSEGHIHLYFIRPFVGQTVIPSTKLVEVYLASSPGVSSTTPVSTVTMSGTVTVPQNCEINPQPIVIDFGDIMSSDFTTKGAMPRNFTPERKEITVGCRNISDGVKVSLSFQAEADPSDPTLLKTTNGDIAVKLQGGDGNAISPSNGTLAVDFDYPSQKGNAEIVAYPVNTSGKTPEVGDFNATATIKAEIE
ncbi:fimbrial protein [Serratia sp. NPDC078593]|uniref:fimbrial protein n=1 Tax=unclassified Serratia (in: enterobacteria) TaxID=2647522 RepID=UPI0037CEBE4C